MSIVLQDQHWLIETPKNFRDINRSLTACTDGLAAQIKALANTRLDINQLTTLSTTINRLNVEHANLSPLAPFTLGVVGQSTTNLFCAALPAAAARRGVNLKIVESEYNQLVHEALNPESAMVADDIDAILLCLDHRALPMEADVEASIEFIESVRAGFSRGCKTPIIYGTLVNPPCSLLGSFDRLYVGSLANKIRAFNAHLVDMSERYGDYILDVESVAAAIGTHGWYDPAQWNLYKLPFSSRMVPHYVDAVARLIGAIRGLSKKCLVLDLDNTLWGGVIGDDGLEGIRVGQGDATGEAHLNVQQMAIELRQRGIILAVCSKNDADNARLPFRKHPDMLLKEEHIAVFVANWTDKPTNLENIATTLNIGVDALVFVDDNPAERALVRQTLPDVSVPELPADPSLYATTVLNGGYFDAVSFSEDDVRRADQYRENANRAKQANSARNMEDFLASLKMTLEVGSFEKIHIPRVTHLINKTNQFNLTSQRYVQTEVENLSNDSQVITIQARLVDRFGDNGLIAVLIARIVNDICDIDTFLMSCRVLGRRVEEALFTCLVTSASKHGAQLLRGRYIPTEKNAMVADLYDKLGFEQVSDTDGVTEWEMPIQLGMKTDLPFEIRDLTCS